MDYTQKILSVTLLAVSSLCVYPEFSIAQENQCIACHADYWEMMQDSVHTRHQISCDKCHGGDPSATEREAAKAPGTGFIGVPNKVQIAEMCGNCHADIGTMNFFNIPTDQLARFKTSTHGKRLFEEGNEKVATCSDCHDYHDVIAVDDPASPVYPLNVPKTCNRCHGNEKTMAPYTHPTDILNKYTQSVHGKALFEKKDLSVANCSKCHGGHGAVPPGVKEINNTCGKCHVNEKKYFLESVHADASARGEFSECITCHGYHEIEPADLVIYRQKCVQCHKEGEAPLNEGLQLLTMLDGAEKKYQTAEGLVKRASNEGIFVEPEQALLENIKSNVVEMAPLQHTLNKTIIGDKYDNVASAASQIESSLQKKRKDLTWRKVALIPLWIFIIIMSRALYSLYQDLKHQRQSEEDQHGKDENKNE